MKMIISSAALVILILMSILTLTFNMQLVTDDTHVKNDVRFIPRLTRQYSELQSDSMPGIKTDLTFMKGEGASDSWVTSYEYGREDTQFGGLGISSSSSEWVGPTKLGQCGFGGNERGCSYDVHVIENIAYVADWDNGLEIIDVSDPTNPTKVGQYKKYVELSSGSYRSREFNNIFVVGDTVYLSKYRPESWGLGIYIIDVSDPTNPTEQAYFSPKFRDPPRWPDFMVASPVFVSGDIAYVVELTHGLIIIDVSNSTNPTILGQLAFGGVWDNDYDIEMYRSNGIYVSGDIAYLADHRKGFRIIDVSNPYLPRKLGEVTFYGPPHTKDVYVVGDIAYVANGRPTTGEARLVTIDVSDLTSPTKLGEVNTSGYPYNVHVVKNTAYMAIGVNGLEIIDVSDPTNPTRLGQFNDEGVSVYSVFVSDNKAYLANEDKGLGIIDISDPANPIELGMFNDGGYSHNVHVDRNTAYVANSYNGLEITDVSDPTNPTILGHFFDGGSAIDVQVSANIAYVVNENAGLEIIDVSSSSSPKKLGEYSDIENAMSVCFVENKAYVAGGADGLKIIDVSDPANPTSPI